MMTCLLHSISFDNNYSPFYIQILTLLRYESTVIMFNMGSMFIYFVAIGSIIGLIIILKLLSLKFLL